MNPQTRRSRLERKIIELLRAGEKVRAVSRALGVGRPRVREVQKLASTHGYFGEAAKPLPPWPEALWSDDTRVDKRSLKTSDVDAKLTDHVSWMRERLEANWKPITIFEELPLKNVTRSSFYRFLHRYDLLRIGNHQAQRDQRITPIIHAPGEALILDWGKVKTVFDPSLGKNRTLWAFVGVLGCSRLMSVRLVWTNDVKTTIAALESMLKEIGGVPKRLTSDNPKCFALEASNYEPLLNPALERFCAHYGTILECLPPADPQKKGKVERQVPFVRRLFEAYDFSKWQGIEHAQNYINKKYVIANERVHGTTRLKPIEDFIAREAQALKALPALSFEPEEFSEAIVRRDGFVRFANKYYAVADEFIKSTVQVVATAAMVTVFFKGKVLESYVRITDPHITHSTKDHLRKPFERLMHDHGHFIKRAALIGPNVAVMIERLLEKNIDDNFLDARSLWGVLSLDKKFSHDLIDKACRMALARDRIGYRAVLGLINSKIIHDPQKHTNSKPASPFPPPKFGVEINDYKSQLDLNLH